MFSKAIRSFTHPTTLWPLVGFIVATLSILVLGSYACVHGEQLPDVQGTHDTVPPVVLVAPVEISAPTVYVSCATDRKLSRHPLRYESVVVARSRSIRGLVDATYGSAGSRALRSAASAGSNGNVAYDVVYELRAIRVARSSGSNGSHGALKAKSGGSNGSTGIQLK